MILLVGILLAQGARRVVLRAGGGAGAVVASVVGVCAGVRVCRPVGIGAVAGGRVKKWPALRKCLTDMSNFAARVSVGGTKSAIFSDFWRKLAFNHPVGVLLSIVK